MTIKIGNFSFEGIYPFRKFNPKEIQGIYAILIPRAINNNYTVVYIGQSSNLSERGLDNTHHAYPCWINCARTEQNLFIAILNLSRYSEQQRKAVEEELIKQYAPTCNIMGKN